MIFRSLDQNGDWQFGHGISNYLDGNAAIGLNIKTRLLSWVGDCFFDQNAGIDWKNRLGSKNQTALLQMDLKRIILQSYGVVGIVSFSASLTNRNFSADYAVNTIFSQQYIDSISKDF